MTAFCFQTQLVSIMDALCKATVTEIGKLVEIESKMLKIEITRGRNEIASLTEKLNLMETLLHMAQRGRPQDAREGLESVVLEPERARPASKSEFAWENISSSPETSTSVQDEQHPPAETLQLPTELVVKEEPTEVDIREVEQERTNENSIHKSLEVSQRHKPVSERHLPVYLDCFVSLNAPSCLTTPERREVQWNPPLTQPHASHEADRSMPGNATPQNPLKSAKMHHLRSTATAKRFGCLQCGKSFRCYSQLEIHQRSHTGEKPFRCTLCGKRYAQKGHLYTHQRTHTGEKPYRCPICGKGFIQKCTLDMHQRTHTGEKPFVCVQCGKGFTKNCNLKKHLLVHLESDMQLCGSGGLTQSETTMNETASNTVAGLMFHIMRYVQVQLGKGMSASHNAPRNSCKRLALVQRSRSSFRQIHAEPTNYLHLFRFEMMCDTTNRSFRMQLAAILEKLTKTALMEIGNLADECSSVLLGEISLHKSENEALKKRCYSLELQLRAAREAHYYPSHVNNLGRRNPEGQDVHKTDHHHQQQQQQQQQQTAAPAIDGVFGKDWCMDLWREDKRASAQRKEAAEPVAMSSLGAPVFDIIDTEPDLIFIKEEAYDDHSFGQQMRLTDNRKDVETLDGELHRSVNELQLHSEVLNSFPLMADNQAQRSQPNIMDKLIEDAAMSTLLDAPGPPSAPDYVDYTGNIHGGTGKQLSLLPAKPIRPSKHFQCLFCGKVFNYLSSLKVHVRRHSGEKPFSCTVCGKRFAQKTYLKLHQRVHSGEKPYSCPNCGRSFSQKSSLNIHLRTHTGEKPYSCMDCGKCYAYKYGLNHHQCFTHMKPI
nr:zinc finger protein 135 [Syngnathus scovelli]